MGKYKDEFGIEYSSYDLPDEQIELLANSNISNLAFCEWWTHPEEPYEGHVYRDLVRVKVIQKRGYEKVRNVIKYLFRELDDPNYTGSSEMRDFLGSIPREAMVEFYREACRYHFGEDYLELHLNFDYFVDFGERNKITQKEFDDDEIWKKIDEYQKYVLNGEYDDWLSGKMD